MTIVLNFKIEFQKGIRLCWSAVVASLHNFYQGEEKLDQIEFAKSIHGSKYDQFHDPILALAQKGLFHMSYDRPLFIHEVFAELKKGHPVISCMKHFVGWHLVVIYGLTEENNVLVADPMRGNSEYSIQSFTDQYEKYYEWTHSYLVRPPNRL